MSEIRDYGVTVEEYLEGLEKGIDILELRSLEEWGIPTDLALELMTIAPKVEAGTATPEEIVRGLMIMSPPLRQLKQCNKDVTMLD
ncbi:MAG: hypothetical protein KME64_28435 [Scytonematopsis contorta HA4267-MV1]|jgi:hypothetical protein|nr:hypothetical protein [Scytonematopsis contorta HA4267-MV1]